MLPTAEFISRLREAAMCEAWVAAKLAKEGIYVLHHPITVAQDQDEVARFGQQYDLTLYNKHPNEMEWLLEDPGAGIRDAEVKSQSYYFTDPYTFALAKSRSGQKSYLCSQSSWLKKCPGSDATLTDYFFVSHKTMAIVWVPKGTAVELGVEGHDPRRGETYKVVAFEPTFARTFKEFCDGFKAQTSSG